GYLTRIPKIGSRFQRRFLIFATPAVRAQRIPSYCFRWFNHRDEARRIIEGDGLLGVPLGYLALSKLPANSTSRIYNAPLIARLDPMRRKMVHVPMQDRGQPQLGKMRQLDAQRTARQLEMPRRLDQPAQRHSFQRHGVAAAQRVDVYAMTEIRCDHREASE